ncbi:MAG TPA: DUF2207 domain-containing protein [Acidimicrobiales bacterium]
MRTRQRRRLDIALMAGGAVAAGAAALAGGIAGNSERITRYWAVATVGTDGSAQVTEMIDYEFGAAADKHGIFRVVPGVDPAAPISVESPDAPDDAQVTAEGDGVRIRIGDPDETVSGRHRYRIDYPLPEVRRDDALDWDTLGTEWDVGADDVEVHLVTPFVLDGASCFEGRGGSGDRCDIREVEPGHVVATASGLGAGEAVSIEGTAGAALPSAPATPEPPAEPPDDPGAGLLRPAGTAAAAAAVAAVPVAVAVRRAGRERVAAGGAADAAYGGPPLGGPWTAPPGTGGSTVPPPPPVPGAAPAPAAGGGGAAAPAPPAGWRVAEPERWPEPASLPGVSEVRVDAADLAGMATTEFAPPAGISPAHGGIVLTEAVRDEHQVAWLIQAAIDGVVDLEEQGSTTLRRIAGAPASAEQQAVFARMFAAGPVLEMGSYDEGFADGWRLLGERLAAWRRTSGLWDDAADARKVVVRVLGIVAAVAGGVAAVAGGALAARYGPGWLALAAAGGLLAGGGLAAALGAWELHVRTAAGSALWLRIESFRRFLAASEAYHAEEAARRGVLREYTAWAVAVGEIGRWQRAVTAAAIPPDVAGVGYAYMAPMLMASAASTATAPSSSGGGGSFGGGSVGGGAGGGGGGSW